MNETQWRGRMLRCLVLVTVSIIFVGCATERNAGATADIQLDVERASVGQTQVDVQISDSQGQPVSGAGVQLRGDMTHAGMQPVITAMEAVGSGHYRARDFEFNMAGDWVLTVEARLPDGTRVERMFEVWGVEK
jgi:hypothetical protein